MSDLLQNGQELEWASRPFNALSLLAVQEQQVYLDLAALNVKNQQAQGLAADCRVLHQPIQRPTGRVQPLYAREVVPHSALGPQFFHAAVDQFWRRQAVEKKKIDEGVGPALDWLN